MAVGTSTFTVPQRLREAWDTGDWRPIREGVDKSRFAALPQLLAILDRFLQAESGLLEFVPENQDFSIAEPHWGFKGFAQMQLNQYAKIASAAGLIDDAERSLRFALPVPSDEEQARRKIDDLVSLTQRFDEVAEDRGLGRPAPRRVPMVVSYFWEAQDRDSWPIAYPNTKRTLEATGLYREGDDPAESYLALRSTVLDLGRALGGDVWQTEGLLSVLARRDDEKKREEKKQLEEAKRRRQPPEPPDRPDAPPVVPHDIYAAYREQDLIFSDEIITTFVLSLLAKPFVILTGISGTGKTKIAQGLARAFDPDTSEFQPEPTLEPGNEGHASFRLSDSS